MEKFEPLQELIDNFRKLDGVGKKNATKMAFSIFSMSDDDVMKFASDIVEAKKKIHLCKHCQNISLNEICDVCSDESRDHSIICVVQDPQSALAIEKVKEYNGLYHVLHGTLSPVKGIGPEQLKIKELLERLTSENIKEVIIATNLTVEGEATSMYISKLIKPFGIKVTRIANGLPVGADLEYADSITLFRAIQGRRDIN